MPKLLAIAAAISLAIAGRAEAAKVTVEDLMRLRSIIDVRISPDGQQVAYAVSTPSLERNAHEAAIYVVASRGGQVRCVAEGTRIFGTRLPAPKLRWSTDGTSISFLGFAGDRSQVFVVAGPGGEARALTTAPEGVLNYEWAPDGKSIAYLTRDPMSEEEQRRRKDNSYVIHVDSPEPATRLCLQPLDGAGARALRRRNNTWTAFPGRRTEERSPTPRRRSPGLRRSTRRAFMRSRLWADRRVLSSIGPG